MAKAIKNKNTTLPADTVEVTEGDSVTFTNDYDESNSPAGVVNEDTKTEDKSEDKSDESNVQEKEDEDAGETKSDEKGKKETPEDEDKSGKTDEEIKDVDSVIGETEELARGDGWVSKEEWVGGGGNPGVWVDSKVWIQRGLIIGKRKNDDISKMGRKVRGLEKSIDGYKKYQEILRQGIAKKRGKELDDAKVAAIESGDVEEVKAIDEQIKEADDLEVSIAETESDTNDEEKVDPNFEDWIGDNPWYKDDDDAHNFSEARGKELSDKGVSLPRILDIVSKEVAETFGIKTRTLTDIKNPQKITNETKTTINRNKSDVIDTRHSVNTERETGLDGDGLNEIERKTMEDLVSLGTVTKESYIKDMVEMRNAG